MPRARMKASNTRRLSWWLASGEEECPHCGQLYIYELEFRCPDCDRSSCPQCKKTHAEQRFVCPECVDGRKEPDGVCRG